MLHAPAAAFADPIAFSVRHSIHCVYADPLLNRRQQAALQVNSPFTGQVLAPASHSKVSINDAVPQVLLNQVPQHKSCYHQGDDSNTTNVFTWYII